MARIDRKQIVAWLRRAYQVGMDQSDDMDTKVGAILVVPWMPEDCVEGANRIPTGLSRRPSRKKRPDKYRYLVHAEEDSILQAAKLGRSTKGLTMICPWAACARCSRMIVQAGIKRVINHKSSMDATPDRWKADIELGHSMLREANVDLITYDGWVEDVKSKFDGKVWYP